MLTFVFFLTGYILGWQCFVGAEDIHCVQSVLLTAAQPQPLLAFPPSQQQRPCLTVPNWAHKGNPNWSEIFRVLCKVYFSNRCPETPNTVRCRSLSFTVPKGTLDYRDQKDLDYLN